MSRLPLFPDFDRPLIFAHRGLSAVAPENTMAAFRLARERGVPGLELDIHLLASGEPVVVHDADAMRTCGQSLRFENARLAQVRELDAGTWKGPDWSGERVPLLAEVFEEFGASIYYDIEIKSKTAEDRGLELALAGLVADFRLHASVAVSSFNPVALARFKRFAPRVPTAVIWCDEPDMPWYLRRGEGRWIARCDYLKPDRRLVRKPVAAPREGGLRGIRPGRTGSRPVVPWVVDDSAEARELLRSGCAGIVSNDPSALDL
ncbi:MAG: glycerophosphodiester phosphodiesterase [Spirochaetales bacterium]|nr:glycerophosphodiester phosphodiesterase [Spirochaetales bacterium]